MINVEILGLFNTTEECLIKNLVDDVREIFTTMVGVDISSSQMADTQTKFKDSVTAMVGFAGSYNGMISINTPQKLALFFASQMLGMEVTECGDDVHDALGEIANMIAGSFNHHFITNGHEANLSTPSVISGEQYFMTVGSIPDTLSLIFESGKDFFEVSIFLEVGN